VAGAIRDLVSLNGIHNVQIFVTRGDKVKVLQSGDPLSPVVRLVDGDVSADTTSDASKFLESADGFLYQRDAVSADKPSEESASEEFGFFNF
jgi:hypothetical protein